MKVWVFANENGEIISVSESTMAGNSGWSETTNTKLGAGIEGGYEALKSLLSTSDGVPRYLLTASGGAVARTQEAIAADTPAPESAPTYEQQLAALQVESAATMEAVAEVYEMMLGGE